ncbi:MAG: hypothetical protein GOV15_01485, partial [Candidatus Diapherotrites archaeon]|nr:hypothetical protein [Candidatus Diapherotrites archaeon]
MKRVVFSLGGSLLFKKKSLDAGFLKEFSSLIKRLHKKGFKVSVVVGGGSLARDFISAARKVGVKDNHDLDWVAIGVTRANAELVLRSLKPVSAPEISTSLSHSV